MAAKTAAENLAAKRLEEAKKAANADTSRTKTLDPLDKGSPTRTKVKPVYMYAINITFKNKSKFAI